MKFELLLADTDRGVFTDVENSNFMRPSRIKKALIAFFFLLSSTSYAYDDIEPICEFPSYYPEGNIEKFVQKAKEKKMKGTRCGLNGFIMSLNHPGPNTTTYKDAKGYLIVTDETDKDFVAQSKVREYIIFINQESGDQFAYRYVFPKEFEQGQGFGEGFTFTITGSKKFKNLSGWEVELPVVESVDLSN